MQEKRWAPVNYVEKLPESRAHPEIVVWHYNPPDDLAAEPFEPEPELTGPPWLEPVLMAAIIVVVVAMLVVTIFVRPHPVKS